MCHHLVQLDLAHKDLGECQRLHVTLHLVTNLSHEYVISQMRTEQQPGGSVSDPHWLYADPDTDLDPAF
jgi:hypothetical protein